MNPVRSSVEGRIPYRMVVLCAVMSALVAGVAAPQSADARTPITPENYGKWETLGSGTLSPDGEWLAFPISRVNDENELRIRRVRGDETIVAAYGSRPAFSRDGHWLAYSIGVSEKERKRLDRQKKPVRNKLGLRDLRTGDSLVIDDVQSFSFADDGAYLAMRRYPPTNRAADSEHDGVDLVIRTLASGSEVNFGNVSQYAWQDDGRLLAFVIDAAGRAGNGVEVFDPQTGVLRTLESKPAQYKGLVWREGSDDLAVLKVRGDDDRYEDSTHVILAWRGLERDARSFEFDPDSAAGFPTDTRVVDYRSLAWSDDGATIYFGIKERKPKPADSTAADSTEATGEGEEKTDKSDEAGAEDEERSTVQIWHADDIDIFPRQKVEADRERRKNYLTAWQLDAGTFVRLGTELVEDVTVAKGDRWAVGTDQTPYEGDRMFGPVYRDLYVIDVQTGEATKVKDRIQYNYGPSSGGKYLLYLEADDFWTYDFATGRHANITADVATKFVNLDDDHTVQQKPPYGVSGWTKDDRTVLLYDKYDIWQLQPDGSRATRLTRGAEDSVRYRRLKLDPEEDYIDPSVDSYLSAYGEWTKQYGFARVRFGREPERLVWQDANVGRLIKAENADVYAYVVQNFNDSPDYFVAGPDLADPIRVTETNPFQSEYAWGRSELIEYRNEWGRRLQGALFYPAGYEPGKQYPMIVYIYEIRSPSVHTYYVPSPSSEYNTAVFTSEGYFVLQPDIVYRDRQPGRSAVAAIVPAVEKVLQTGMIDPERVGLVGHSWGGYETAFTVTQTDIFAAAIAGAPLTNLVSMYLSVYWNTGGTDARIFEISQGRMEVPFWEDMDAYMANSPVFHVADMTTPLLVAHGDVDGAVDFNQGVEFYNAARRADKEFVLLVYEGENHHNRKKANRIDYHDRVMQWFGHYLKGEPAPDWIARGVSYLDQERAKQKEKDQ